MNPKGKALKKVGGEIHSKPYSKKMEEHKNLEALRKTPTHKAL